MPTEILHPSFNTIILICLLTFGEGHVKVLYPNQPKTGVYSNNNVLPNVDN